MANLCHPHEMTELVDRFQNWRGFDCPYCKIAELEAANREFALNEAKTQSGWFIKTVREQQVRIGELMDALHMNTNSAMHSGGSADPERQGIDVPVIGSASITGTKS